MSIETLVQIPAPVDGTVLLTGAVAQLLGVSPDTVRWWNRSGILPARKTSSGTRLFDSRDVESLRRKREGQLRPYDSRVAKDATATVGAA